MSDVTIPQTFDLAVQHHKAGRLQQAEQLYRQVLAQQPEHAHATFYLGKIAHQTGHIDIALDLIRKSIALDPNFAEAHYTLGNILRDQGHLEEAIAAFGQVVALNPDSPKAFNNLGSALARNGQVEESIAAFGRAIALDPHYANALNNLGTALELAGDLAGAERCYRQAIKDATNHVDSHAKLASLLGRNLPDKDLAAMETLLADPSINPASKSYLHFAMAHVLDGRERYQEAADHLRLANALYQALGAAKGEVYDPAAHERFVDRIIQTCTPEFFDRVRGMGQPTRRPVFIFGMARSGTTLAEQILAGHSQVFAAGELNLGQDDFLSLAGESARTLSWNVRSEMAFQSLSGIDRQTIQQLAEQHLSKLEKINATAEKIVDKMPENYLYLGLLAAIFPQATFIHCRRDLRDVAISCFMTRFEKVSWSNDLEQITTRCEQYRRLMRHWSGVLKGRWLDCDYEQTVSDLPGTARKLVACCGLEWEPACVDFHLVKRRVDTASRAQVRRPIYSRSVGRWKNYEQILGPVLERLS